MPPLTNTAVLALVYGDHLAEILTHASKPATPTLDRIVDEGVTTGLMLTPSELTSAAGAASLCPQVYQMAVSITSASGIVSLPAEDTAAELANPSPGTRVFLIDAGSDLHLAEAAVTEAAAAFPARFKHEPTRASNPDVAPTASAIIGVMLVGRGEWDDMLPSPRRKGPCCDFPLPRQSFETGDEETQLAGFVAWSGEGLVRRDDRTRLGHAGSAPGESFLRLEQAVAEPLSKTGLLKKYGA
ncbi:unnamed protein product [Chondrus crispus]|uniref:Uncharacterized protein n=1 Tax=Chondrus crispus TaxID=2769 RepID=R7Q9R0_CHOCR|nr:unnamed protein product [Chondrus crispus]CDF34215.1 unnamed protein product [Chondrus crispus]|eukprot:XP_005714034.1 unnamed protein product [Chondrus crispus]